MDNNIFLQNSKGEQFDFELSVNGLSGADVHVRFVLKSDPFHMMFPCTHVSGDKWNLDLPAMPFLDVTTYNFVLEAIVDGYYFPAHEGTLTVTKSPEVYIKKADAEMKVTSSTASGQPPRSFDDAKADNQEEQKSEEKNDEFKKIINRLKSPVADPDAKADKKEEDKKVDEQKADPFADAQKVADQILSEDAPAPKKSKKPAKKANGADIIREHKEAQRLKKEQDAERRKLINESRKAKKKPVVEEKPVVEQEEEPQLSEKDLAAKAILAESKSTDATPKSPIFKKGKTVTK